MIKYQKTDEKSCGTNIYDVFLDGRKIGNLYRAYYPAIGLGPKYTGFCSGSYDWIFDVGEWAYDSKLFRGGMYSFDSQKEAKVFLEGDKSKWQELS